MIPSVLVLLFSLGAPLPLLIIEKFLPYPFIIEELVKLLFVLILVSQEKILKRKVFIFVIASGFLFTLSESIFYLVNIFLQQNLFVFFQRLFFTGVLHIVTMAILYFFVRKKSAWWILGLVIVVIVHLIYNYAILIN